MDDPIINYIQKNGECAASDIKIAGYSLAAVKTKVLTLYKAGVLTRRAEPIREGQARFHWVYELSGVSPKQKSKSDRLYERLKLSALKNEPSYAYHLRNLPRDQHGTN
jgi:hypothetical protein